jgi:hypothetical protein
MLMFSLKERLRLLTRIAQTAPAASNSALPQSAPTPAATIPPAPAFRATDVWGWLARDYGSQTILTINSLVSLLNTALHYSSNGQYNFQILKNENFQVDPSGVPSVDTKNLIFLSSMVYRTFLNAGHEFRTKPTGTQIAGWANNIINSQPFLNLSQVNPTGPLAQKIQGNIKDMILNFVRYLIMYNPVSQQQSQSR